MFNICRFLVFMIESFVPSSSSSSSSVNVTQKLNVSDFGRVRFIVVLSLSIVLRALSTTAPCSWGKFYPMDSILCKDYM